jgi:anti-anti-sigma regulatory factor
VSSYLADVVNMDTSGLVALEELHKELACLGIQVSVTNMLRFPTYV